MTINRSRNYKKDSFISTTIKNILHKPVSCPFSVQFAITDDCNMNCVMCPIHHVDIKRGHADFDTFKKIIDRLYGVEEISLTGLGEPLFYPKIIDAVRYCKSKKLIVKTTTNGLMLDENLEELVLSGLDVLSVSIDSINDAPKGAHSNCKISQSVEKLIAIKNRFRSCTPKIVLQPLMFEGREKDLYDIIEWGAKIGVHRINVLRMHKYFDTAADLKRPNREQEKKIFEQLSKLRKKYNVRIDCIQDQFFTGVKGMFYKHFKSFLGLDSFCTRLLNYPYINRDGDVIPCCVLPDHKFGNVLETDIRDIWHGEKIYKFRRHHTKVTLCSKCDNWRIKQLI